MRIRNTLDRTSRRAQASQACNPYAHKWQWVWTVAVVASAVPGMAGCAIAKFTPRQLQARLQSAALIGDDWKRDQALAGIATDAARSGQITLCQTAVDQIRQELLRDHTLMTCAQGLDNAGLRQSAESLVNHIGNDNARDQIFAAFAKNAPGSSAADSKVSKPLQTLK